MERSQEQYHHPSPLRQEYRRMLWRSHSPSGSMSLPLTLLLEVRQQEIVGKRLVIGQKIWYHTRVKSQGESGVSRHSPDPRNQRRPALSASNSYKYTGRTRGRQRPSVGMSLPITSHPSPGADGSPRKE